MKFYIIDSCKTNHNYNLDIIISENEISNLDNGVTTRDIVFKKYTIHRNDISEFNVPKDIIIKKIFYVRKKINILKKIIRYMEDKKVDTITNIEYVSNLLDSKNFLDGYGDFSIEKFKDVLEKDFFLNNIEFKMEDGDFIDEEEEELEDVISGG